MPDTMAGRPGGPIAIVAHTHPSISKGGAEIAAYALYEGLRKIGTDAIFIAVCPSQDRGRLLLGSDREFAIISDPSRYDHFYHLSAADVWRQLKNILVRQDVWLVNFHHFLHIGVNALRALSVETQIPFTLTLHEFLAICVHHGQMVTRPARRLCNSASPVACATCFPEHSRQQFTARKAIIQGALLPAAGFISPSHFLADRMVDWGLPRDKFVVIENGLRRLDKQSDGQRRAAGTGVSMVEGRPWTFGYFGQITPFKGTDTLLDTIELLAKQPDIGRKVRIRVHGNLIGQEPAFLARFNAVFEKNSFATYAGPYDNADVRKLMAACDYVVVPSTWWENSPVVIQEAYAAGRPVICTGIGGMAEKVPNRRAGLHFRPGDATDLARAMSEAADDVLYKALCSGLPEVSDQTTMARDYLATFNRLVKPPAASEAARPTRRRTRVIA
jgi:glycosyltransferase involved in cell wall biosynthesis